MAILSILFRKEFDSSDYLSSSTLEFYSIIDYLPLHY